MVQIDVPVAFAVGSLFADAARQQLREGRAAPRLRALLYTNLFNIFFFVWIPVYFLMNYFGWETSHMWWHEDSVSAYPFFLPIFLLVFFAMGNLGFLLGERLVRAGRTWANRGVYLGILVYSAIWILGQVDRTFRLGSYRAWQAGTAPWFYQDPVFVGMLITTLIIFFSALAVFVVRLRRAPEER